MASVNLTFDVSNLSQAEGEVDIATKEILYAITEVVVRNAGHIMMMAKARAPVKTGALAASGHVSPPVASEDGNIGVILSFGGPSAVYAHYLPTWSRIRAWFGRAKARKLAKSLHQAVPQTSRQGVFVLSNDVRAINPARRPGGCDQQHPAPSWSEVTTAGGRMKSCTTRRHTPKSTIGPIWPRSAPVVPR